MKQMKTTALLALVTLALTACGGGGGGGSSETPIGTFSATLSAKPTSIAEGASVPVTVSVSNVKNTANLTMTSSSTGVTVTKGEGNTFTLQAADVDRNTTALITFKATDGTDASRSVTTTFSVTVDNASFTESLASVEFLISQKARLVDATEEKAMIAALGEVSKLFEVAPTVQPQAVNVEETGKALAASIDAINVAQYKSGTIGEAAVTAAYNKAMLDLGVHLDPLKTELNAGLTKLSSHVGEAVQIDGFTLNKELKTASFFIGNPSLGQVVNNEWKFNDNVAYVAGLVRSACEL